MKLVPLIIAGLIFGLVSCGPESESQNREERILDEESPIALAETNENEFTYQDTTPDLKPMEYVVMKTNKGEITLELDPNRAPITVENFLAYVDAGFYDGTIFHRVIPNFMIQGGGFTPDGVQKETRNPILLESQNGLSNEVGTIAMARTNAPNSATSQFFINVQNNTPLDYRPGSPGYAVFGRVTSGMEVVNEIRQVETGRFERHSDWPVEPVIIEKVSRE